MPTTRHALIRSLFDEYIELYAARDERLTERFSANFSGYTSGGDFLVTSCDQWIAITRQDFAQVPGRIRIEMLDVALQDICDHTVVVTAFFRIHLPIPDRILSRETARLVLVFRLEENEWKIAHSGISIPYFLVREGEVYPLQGLAERNSELEVQVETAERALAQSEARFRNMVDTTDGIVWEADAQTFTFTFISQKAERLLGFPVSDWLEPGFWVAHLHPEDQAWAPEFCASCTGRLEPHDFEYRFIVKDGGTVWLRDIVTVVAENGQPRWLRGVMVDVSAQKQIEAELNEAHKMLEDAQHLARLGGWKFDNATGTVKWSKEVFNIYGVPADFDPSDAATNIAFFDPEDRPILTRAFSRAIEHGEPYDLELRLMRPDGELIWVRTLGEPQLRNGQVISVAGNIMDITERKLAEEEIRSLAFFDPLTHLPNRRLFFDRLNVALTACARRNVQGALLFIDLDNFKYINDTFGHETGDLLLQEAARRLKSCVREDDTVARLGGDEFVVMLEFHDQPGDNAGAGALKVGEKILATLGQHYWLDGQECRSTPSVGVALFDCRCRPQEVLRNADQAMYRAKASGRHAMCFHGAEQED